MQTSIEFGNKIKRQTPFGTIPDEWDFKPIGFLIRYFGGNAFKSEDSCREGVKWLKIANVGCEGIRWDEESFLPSDFIHKWSRYLLKKGDIVMALTRPILDGKLKISIIDSCDTPALLNQRVAKLLAKEKCEIKFYYYIHQMPKFIHSMNVCMAGTDPPNIGNGDLEKIKVPLPPLPEQKAIAQILSTWDKAIDKLQQLITAKKQRKKALMQLLLSGKKRFPGFTEEWKEVRVGDLFERVTRTSQNSDIETYTISSKRGFVTQENKFNRIIAGSSLAKYTLLYKNEFSYNKGNSKTFPYGCIFKFESEEGLVPFVYISFKLKKNSNTNAAFYKFYFHHGMLERQLKKIITSGARGDGLLNVSADDFFKLKILKPEFKEQTKIASVLQAADKEIDTLTKKLEALKQQKKGLMQKLLTGQIRVKHLATEQAATEA